MNIFTPEGYPDIKKIVERVGMPFSFLYGGRGIGKTFSAILYALERGDEFIFTRRLQSQADSLMNPKLNPFNPIAEFLHAEIELKPLSKDNKAIIYNGNHVGITGSLSKMSTLRGFASLKTKMWIHDEFIPESTEAKMKGDEGDAFNNAYETINRNRELEGEPPLIVLCLANANDVGNPIFMDWNLVNVAMKMELQKKEIYINNERGIFLCNMENSPISQAKRETALYKAKRGTDFEKMALDNIFVDDSIAVIKSKDLKPYKPLVRIANCTVYKHKSDNKYYYSEHNSGSPDVYTTSSAHLEKFRKKYYFLWNAYLDERIEFENKLCSLLFEKLW